MKLRGGGAQAARRKREIKMNACMRWGARQPASPAVPECQQAAAGFLPSFLPSIFLPAVRARGHDGQLKQARLYGMGAANLESSGDTRLLSDRSNRYDYWEVGGKFLYYNSRESSSRKNYLVLVLVVVVASLVVLASSSSTSECSSSTVLYL
jgi:hypothetical protein